MSMAMIESSCPYGAHEEIARRCSGDLAAYDDPIARDKDFLNVEFHVRDRLGKASDNLDRCLTAPAFGEQIARARLVVRSEDLFLECVHIALDRLVEQAVPGAMTARACASVRLCAETARGAVSTAAAATS